MKWKELLTRKRLLLSLVAVATLATIFVLYATMHTTTTPTSSGTSIPALPTETHVAETQVGDLMQAFGVTDSGTPSSSVTANQLVGNSQVRQGRGGAGFGAVVDDGSPPTQLADNSYVDSSPPTNTDADLVVRGSDGKGSGTAPDDFTKILLANNDYPKHDHDFQAFESHFSSGGGPDVSVGGGPDSIASDRSSGDLNEPQTSHAPEPASMLLLGTALVGAAVFARKLKKM